MTSLNRIALDLALVEQLENALKKIRKSVVELASLAFQIREQHLDNGKYDKEFNSFWKNYDLEEKFGSLATFTKYALAGEGINKVRAQYSQYENRLPVTLTALYEFSQLTSGEMSLCFESTFRRRDITDDRSKWLVPKKPKPLINPSTTAATIKSWRMNWRNPRAVASDKRRLKFAEIRVHGSLFDFKDGEHVGVFSKEDLLRLTEELKATIAKFHQDYVRLDLFDQNLIAGYEKRERVSVQTREDFLKKKKPN